MSTELSENDDAGIAALLTGRRIVAAEMGTWNAGTYTTATGRLTLDDGTTVYVVPNVGGCACSAGDYELTHLAAVDNIITSVRLVNEPDDDSDWNKPYVPGRYQIFVVADAVEVNVMTAEGSDGNGYYGTGYRLIIAEPGSVGGTEGATE